jgi:hypothetical protein
MNFRTSNNKHFFLQSVILGVPDDPHTTLSLRGHSIAVKTWPGVSGCIPRTLFTRIGGMCDSELFGHVFKTHKSNPIIHVYELANLFNCRHSKNRLFEFVCQYFESPKSIQFRTPRQNVSISPLVCVKIELSLKLLFPIYMPAGCHTR